MTFTSLLPPFKTCFFGGQELVGLPINATIIELETSGASDKTKLLTQSVGGRVHKMRRTAAAGRFGLVLALVIAFSFTGSAVAAADEPASKATSEEAAPPENPVKPEPSPSPAVTAPTTQPGPADVQQQAKSAQDSAETVNQIPGVNVNPKDLMPPQLPPIRGFHPIKRMLRPVENLEAITIRLQQQIMRLEGPIAALQPRMQELQRPIGRVADKMGSMDDRLGSVRENLSGVHAQLGSVQEQVRAVQSGMTGLHEDIAAVQSLLSKVREDVNKLREPIEQLRGPLLGVAGPLTAVQGELHQLQVLVRWVLAAILLSAVGIAIGTPLAGLMLYTRKHKLFSKKSGSD